VRIAALKSDFIQKSGTERQKYRESKNKTQSRAPYKLKTGVFQRNRYMTIWLHVGLDNFLI